MVKANFLLSGCFIAVCKLIYTKKKGCDEIYLVLDLSVCAMLECKTDVVKFLELPSILNYPDCIFHLIEKRKQHFPSVVVIFVTNIITVHAMIGKGTPLKTSNFWTIFPNKAAAYFVITAPSHLVHKCPTH